MNFKCCKCNQLKNKDGFDEKWFKVVKKVCYTCEIKALNSSHLGDKMKAEIKAINKITSLKGQLHRIALSSSEADEQLWQCNKFKSVWMRKGEKDIAYRKDKYSFVPYKSFKSRYTGKSTIKVKSFSKNYYYALDDLYKWIWETEKVI